MIQRKCIGCGEIKERSELIRIMRDYKTKEIIIMPNSKHFGHSVYLCYNNECLKIALKKKRIEKLIKNKLSDNIVISLQNILETNTLKIKQNLI